MDLFMDKATAAKTAAKWYSDNMGAHPSEEKLTVFREALAKEVRARLDRDGGAFIGHNPDDVLRAAAEKAGLRVKDFPYGMYVGVETFDREHYFVAAYTNWGHHRKLIEPASEFCAYGERRKNAED